MNQLEEKLKIYELEEIERRRKDANRTDVEARIIEFSKNDYRMKIWNSGQATAYDVDIEVPDECKGIVWRNKVPYEVLESGKSFEERVIVYDTIPTKFLGAHNMGR